MFIKLAKQYVIQIRNRMNHISLITKDSLPAIVNSRGRGAVITHSVCNFPRHVWFLSVEASGLTLIAPACPQY